MVHAFREGLRVFKVFFGRGSCVFRVVRGI